ncbi:MAG: hypothetical protein WCJ30_07510 [Deltaproteobacteria bacterium]
MTAESPDVVERARERTMGVAFALAGSSMLAASLVVADVVMRVRFASHVPATSRPPMEAAVAVTALLVLTNLGFGTVAAKRNAERSLRRWGAWAAIVLGLCAAAVEFRAGLALFRAPARDVFGAIGAALLAWHGLHQTIAAVATVRALPRGPSAFAAPALLWNFAAFAWIVLAAVLWVL